MHDPTVVIVALSPDQVAPALIERKRALRRVIPTTSVYLLYVDHIESEGEQMFELACERDPEGIVAKHRQSRYTVEDGNPSWVKSQLLAMIIKVHFGIASPKMPCTYRTLRQIPWRS